MIGTSEEQNDRIITFDFYSLHLYVYRSSYLQKIIHNHKIILTTNCVAVVLVMYICTLHRINVHCT